MLAACLLAVCLHNYCTFDAIVLDRLLDPWPALKTLHLDGYHYHYDSAAVIDVCRRKWPALVTKS